MEDYTRQTLDILHGVVDNKHIIIIIKFSFH